MLAREPDPTSPYGFVVRSNQLPVLAAVPDVLAARLCRPGDQLTVHAWHYGEQTSGGHSTYATHGQIYQNELTELGPGAGFEIVELPRPMQQNIVYTDRFHLLAWGAGPQGAGRLLGLYVGTKGSLTLCVHDPTCAGMLMDSISRLPHGVRGPGAGLDQAAMSLTRFTIGYHHTDPTALRIFASPALAQLAVQAVDDLARSAAEHI